MESATPDRESDNIRSIQDAKCHSGGKPQGHNNSSDPEQGEVGESEEYSPYMDLFFPFIIHEEHRLSEQAVVLAGLSIQHRRRKAVLK